MPKSVTLSWNEYEDLQTDLENYRDRVATLQRHISELEETIEDVNMALRDERRKVKALDTAAKEMKLVAEPVVRVDYDVAGQLINILDEKQFAVSPLPPPSKYLYK